MHYCTSWHAKTVAVQKVGIVQLKLQSSCQSQFKKSHSDEETILSLPEVGSTWVRVNLHINLQGKQECAKRGLIC